MSIPTFIVRRGSSFWATSARPLMGQLVSRKKMSPMPKSKCPSCGKDGYYIGSREFEVAATSRRWEDDFRCEGCGKEWHHPSKNMR